MVSNMHRLFLPKGSQRPPRRGLRAPVASTLQCGGTDTTQASLGADGPMKAGELTKIEISWPNGKSQV